MGCARKLNQVGFTLVEIAISLVIIGLLTGGIITGSAMIETSRINKFVQDTKSIESAALTFKDTFGRLLGDIGNPSARLPNCTTTPCSDGGNQNRLIGDGSFMDLGASGEKFSFWHHLAAADLLLSRVRNIPSARFGEGLPKSPIPQVGYRISYSPTPPGSEPRNAELLAAGYSPLMFATTNWVTGVVTIGPASVLQSAPCGLIERIDRKMDDGLPMTGIVQHMNCTVGALNAYDTTRRGSIRVDLRGF